MVRVGNRCLDKVRRRVQNETLGHRGRKHDPLYRIRKLLLAGSERLDERGQDRLLLGLRVGDPHDEVLGAWLAKESVREVYLTDDPDEAALLLNKAIIGCTNDDVAEIQSFGSNARSMAHRDPRPPRDRRVERPHRGPEPLRQESQTLSIAADHAVGDLHASVSGTFGSSWASKARPDRVRHTRRVAVVGSVAGGSIPAPLAGKLTVGVVGLARGTPQGSFSVVGPAGGVACRSPRRGHPHRRWSVGLRHLGIQACRGSSAVRFREPCAWLIGLGRHKTNARSAAAIGTI